MKKHLLAAIVLFSFISAPAFAADAPSAPSPQPQVEGGYWKRVDPEGKGYFTKDAYMAESARRFADIDANHDGKVTKEEMDTYYNKRREEIRERFQQMRANRPGAAAGGAMTPVPAAPAQK